MCCGMPRAEAARLRAGVDYPTDVVSDFGRFLPDEDACERFPERLRGLRRYVHRAPLAYGRLQRLDMEISGTASERRTALPAG